MAKVQGRGHEPAHREQIGDGEKRERAPAGDGGEAKTQPEQQAKAQPGQSGKDDNGRCGMHQSFSRVLSSQPRKPFASSATGSRNGPSTSNSSGASIWS